LRRCIEVVGSLGGVGVTMTVDTGVIQPRPRTGGVEHEQIKWKKRTLFAWHLTSETSMRTSTS
jgi:hypothetical protein